MKITAGKDLSASVRAVLAHLSQGRPLTVVEARKLYGVDQIEAVIHRLIQRGYEIEKSREDGRAVYRLGVTEGEA